MKNYCRLITVDLSRENELDADRRAIQQAEFVEQFKNPADAVIANESMLVLMIL